MIIVQLEVKGNFDAGLRHVGRRKMRRWLGLRSITSATCLDSVGVPDGV